MESPEEIMEELARAASPKYRENLERFSIPKEKAFGVPVPEIRKISKRVRHSRTVALGLWHTRVHEAMILATMVFPPGDLEMDQADAMVEDIDSWDLCDHFAGNLVAQSPIALKAILVWHSREGEFERRSAFSIIAQLDAEKYFTGHNVHIFLGFVGEAAEDNRNFVRKAVSWALRVIGKSSQENNRLAIECAEGLTAGGSRSSHWIARDALRELTSSGLRERLDRPE